VNRFKAVLILALKNIFTFLESFNYKLLREFFFELKLLQKSSRNNESQDILMLGHFTDNRP
jgi:hypothetical protein